MLHDLDEAQCCCLIALVGLARAATVVVEVAETSEEREWRRYLERKRERWEQRRRYFQTTGRRWKSETIPPHILASLPIEQ